MAIPDNIAEILLSTKAQLEGINQVANRLGDLAEQFQRTGQKGQEAGDSFGSFLEKGANLSIIIDKTAQLARFLKDIAVAAFSAVDALASDERAVNTLADTLGIAGDTLEGVQIKLESLGGNKDQAAKVFLSLGKTIEDAIIDPAGEAAKKLEILGVKIPELAASASPLDTALRQIGQSLSGTALSLNQTVTAAEVLGKGFKEIIPVIGDLDADIAKFKAQGLILGPEQSEMAVQLANQLSEVKLIVAGLTTQFTALFLPAVKNITEALQEAVSLLKDNESFTAGFDALKIILTELTSVQLPALIRGIGISLDEIGKFSNEIKTLSDVLLGTDKLAAFGEGLSDAIFPFTEAGIKVRTEIEKNNEFLRIFESNLSAAEKTLRANALVLTTEGKELEARRKRLQENAQTQGEVNQKQIDAIGSTTELLRIIKLLNEEQKRSEQIINLDAQIRIAQAKRTAEELKLSEQQLADNIAQIEREKFEQQIAFANMLVSEINKTISERRQQAFNLTQEILITERDQQKAKEKTLEVEKNFSDFVKATEPEILAAKQRIADAEDKLATITEQSEKRKRAAAEQNMQVADAQLKLKLALLDEEIRKKKELGETDQTIAMLEVQKLNLQIQNAKQRLMDLEAEGKELAKIANLKAELVKLEGDLSSASKRASAAVIQGNKEIAASVMDSIDAFTEFNNRVEALGARANSAAAAIADLNGRIVSIQTTFMADFTSPEGIERVRKQIQALRDDAADLFRKGFGASALGAAAIQSFTETADALQRKLTEALAKQAAAARAEEAARQEADAQDLADRLFEINKRAQDRLLELVKQRRQAERSADKARSDEAKDLENDLAEFRRSLDEDLAEFEQDIAERNAEREFKQQQESIKRLIDFNAAKRRASQDAQDKALADEIQFALEINDVNREIRDLQKELAAADPEDQDRIREQIAEAERKKADLEKRSMQNSMLQKEKQAALEKAALESKSKEEFDAKKSAIDREFALREEESEALARLGEDASAEEIARIKKLFEDRRTLIQEGLAQELTDLATQERLKEEARQRELNAERMADEMRRTDRMNAFNKEVSDRMMQNMMILESIQMRLDMEIEKIKEARRKIEKETRDAVAEVVKQFGLGEDAANKFFDLLKARAEDIKKAFKELIDKQKELASALSDMTSASQPSSSTPGGGTPKVGAAPGSGGPFAAGRRAAESGENGNGASSRAGTTIIMNSPMVKIDAPITINGAGKSTEELADMLEQAMRKMEERQKQEQEKLAMAFNLQ